MTALLLGAAVLLCIGALLGAAWTTQVMSGMSRRHAAERRSLNEGWRSLDSARRSRGEPAYCARCHQRLAASNRLLAVTAVIDEEDDGT